MVAYTLLNVSISEKGEQLYSSLEWDHRPTLSTFAFMGAFVSYIVAFAIAKKITDLKLRNGTVSVSLARYQHFMIE